VKKGDPEDSRLDAAETKTSRSAVTKLHWPGQELLTHVLYRVSALAQKVNEAIGQNGEQINCQAQLARDEAKAGRASMTHRHVDLGPVWVVTYLDASLGRKQWYRSRAGLVTLVTDERALTQETDANRVEHQSKQISRDVKSSLAAEPASLPMAADKHLYAQVLRQALGHGEGSIGVDWRNDFSVLSYVVTDARALYDHDTTTGNLPTERAAVMDHVIARKLIEQALIEMRWVSTQHQPADHLTQNMVRDLTKQHLEQGKVCLIQTGTGAEREQHKATLRTAQRERRRQRVQEPRACVLTHAVYRW
jgi:hypothetical protein